MIPKYDLIDDRTGEIYVFANDLMTDEQIRICSLVIEERSLVATDWEENRLFPDKLENVCY